MFEIEFYMKNLIDTKIIVYTHSKALERDFHLTAYRRSFIVKFPRKFSKRKKGDKKVQTT